MKVNGLPVPLGRDDIVGGLFCHTIYNAGYDVDRVDLAAGIVYLTKAA